MSGDRKVGKASKRNDIREGWKLFSSAPPRQALFHPLAQTLATLDSYGGTLLFLPSGSTSSMDDDFGADADFTAALEAAENNTRAKTVSSNQASKPSANAPEVQQPKPQALPNRAAPSSILVSSRQKGNPILNNIRSLPWEYSDIPSDYVLGATTCALFLSLKYHRLHPEYIYSRIKVLGQKYKLRILLTMVDIQNHEESLKELSKTSLVNNLTLILCWSAQEAGKYLELYKSYENASPTSIRAHQSTNYGDKLLEFITVPRSINKTDAVSLVSAFGTVRAAANARPEEIGMIPGWGEKKVQRWCETVREPFRVRKAAKRGVGLERTESTVASANESMEDGDAESRIPAPPVLSPSRSIQAKATLNQCTATPKRPAAWEPGEDDEEAMLLAAAEQEEIGDAEIHHDVGDYELRGPPEKAAKPSEGMNEGVVAALARLRKN